MAHLRRIRSAPAPQVRKISRTSARQEEVIATLTVKAKVTGGKVTEQDFLQWLMEGIERYHDWRMGWVGADCRGQIVKPKECNVSPGCDD